MLLWKTESTESWTVMECKRLDDLPDIGVNPGVAELLGPTTPGFQTRLTPLVPNHSINYQMPIGPYGYLSFFVCLHALYVYNIYACFFADVDAHLLLRSSTLPLPLPL